MTDQVVLPDKQEQFKLNEVCKLANVQPYMLRFWGTEFPQLEASKSGTGQRLYSRDQVVLILEIRRLLFDEGLTIAGARKKVATMDAGETKPKKSGAKAAPKAEPKPAPEAEDVFTEEPREEPEEKKPKPKIKTSSARRKTPKKEAAAKPKVDKKPTDDVQPLLATLKDVRDEIDKIVTELKSE